MSGGISVDTGRPSCLGRFHRDRKVVRPAALAECSRQGGRPLLWQMLQQDFGDERGHLHASLLRDVRQAPASRR